MQPSGHFTPRQDSSVRKLDGPQRQPGISEEQKNLCVGKRAAIPRSSIPQPGHCTDTFMQEYPFLARDVVAFIVSVSQLQL